MNKKRDVWDYLDGQDECLFGIFLDLCVNLFFLCDKILYSVGWSAKTPDHGKWR